ncbi:B3 domain-containing transcription repressor VAL1 isoform X2 [Andrographis paniculata]|uniref:B3 domain-containing transcription repressor VAL1 isoform X2 n=1 Tax=Andrographis paniculata TaxID=175694 RepID=UPI0021E8D0DC|nr:B3 domain-containing transcription repressor VAL1 isoform X2 [Andrographis paniculata]
MGSNNCTNEACRGTTLSEWKKGWSLKSGGFATLCTACGSAYENSMFCETFHLEESGWRECRVCGKRIHCGCIASRHLHECMDFGGVRCTNCTKPLEVHPVHQSIQIPCNIPSDAIVANAVQDIHPVVCEEKIDGDKFSTEKLLQLTKVISTNNACSAFEQYKQDDPIFKIMQSSKCPATLPEQHSAPSLLKPDNSKPKDGVKGMFESAAQRSINFARVNPLGCSGIGVPFPSGINKGSGQSKSSSPLDQKECHIMPKLPKPSSPIVSEINKGAVSQVRVARPPGEGRGRNQLLPRYWPRITDQELQQLSGDLKSTIVPLFEKILSASDAGRIGRLVLPKACAEAYFPPINQSEGIPIRIQDIKGKEWTFQFRFWPNNNSRMYVLEGVTPCIQNMDVRAGDTVTFSRIDPGAKLVIGCRKALNNGEGQDAQTTTLPNGDSGVDMSLSGIAHIPVVDKKKARNIKNKRLLIHTNDAMELKITWEDAQELLRPSPTSKLSVVMVEDHEFEEFEEPPVFGKRTVFTSRPSGEKEQLAQCDSCLKWRRLPVHALLSVKWSCADNKWDLKRCSCSAPEDINPKDLENICSIHKDSKRRKISFDNRVPKAGEPSGLDALATAAVLGDNLGDAAAESSVVATTRHPRHRPGCSCIVCIQPPSGKGKHEPTCKCNVCLTVRRRFKTLMMRKKKRQSEREANMSMNMNTPKNETDLDEEAKKGQKLDLNFYPRREQNAPMNSEKDAPPSMGPSPP